MKHDVRNRVGNLTLKAENSADAAILALVYRAIAGVGVKSGYESSAAERLYKYLRRHVADDKSDFPLIDFWNGEAK